MGLYFLAYNLINLATWSYMLFMVVNHTSTKFYFSLAYQTVDYLRIIQSVALLEPIHALLLNTSALNTMIQVASRLLIVWGPYYLWQSEELRMSFSYLILVSAWSVAEVIRYSFYAFKEIGYIPYPLLWVRYTGFIVLYPVGVAMEVFTLYMVTLQNHSFNFILYIIMACYIPGLFVLYTHMLKQRSKALHKEKKTSDKVE
eukprot:NODE_163_length_16507_cov_1.031814.p10 type:complete len:201 gc:universal NODE_163_length_16507_cov_1.031814:4062-3460(-)